jgi:hypothetical protein
VFGFRGSLPVRPQISFSLMQKPAFYYNEVTMNYRVTAKKLRNGRIKGSLRWQYQFLIPKYPIGTFSIYSCLGEATFTVIMVTIGVLFIIEHLVMAIWGTSNLTMGDPWTGNFSQIGDVVIGELRVRIARHAPVAHVHADENVPRIFQAQILQHVRGARHAMAHDQPVRPRVQMGMHVFFVLDAGDDLQQQFIETPGQLLDQRQRTGAFAAQAVIVDELQPACAGIRQSRNDVLHRFALRFAVGSDDASCLQLYRRYQQHCPPPLIPIFPSQSAAGSCRPSQFMKLARNLSPLTWLVSG